jgi:hypothetical protein
MAGTRGPGKRRAKKKPAARKKRKTVRKTVRRKPAKKKPSRKTVRRRRPARKTARKAKKKPAKKKSPRRAKKKPSRKTVRRRRPAKKPARRRVKKSARRKPAKKVVRRRRVKRPAKKPVRRRVKRPAKKPARRRVKRPARKSVRRVPAAPRRAAKAPRPRFTFKALTSRLAPPVKPPVEAYSGGKPYIFASYSHRNMKEVFSILGKLADARFRLWYDEGIEPGNEWPEEVGRALTGCQLFLVFMSPAAMESRNVRNEINFASSENKGIMVVNLQPVELSEGMKLQIGAVQYINKHEMTDAEFLEKLKKVIDPVLRQ